VRARPCAPASRGPRWGSPRSHQAASSGPGARDEGDPWPINAERLWRARRWLGRALTEGGAVAVVCGPLAVAGFCGLSCQWLALRSGCTQLRPPPRSCLGVSGRSGADLAPLGLLPVRALPPGPGGHRGRERGAERGPPERERARSSSMKGSL